MFSFADKPAFPSSMNKTVTINEGYSKKFPVLSKPPLTKSTWRFNGVVIREANISNVELKSGGLLSLTNATVENTGNYSVAAENSIGVSHLSFNLNVLCEFLRHL